MTHAVWRGTKAAKERQRPPMDPTHAQAHKPTPPARDSTTTPRMPKSDTLEGQLHHDTDYTTRPRITKPCSTGTTRSITSRGPTHHTPSPRRVAREAPVDQARNHTQSSEAPWTEAASTSQRQCSSWPRRRTARTGSSPPTPRRTARCFPPTAPAMPATPTPLTPPCLRRLLGSPGRAPQLGPPASERLPRRQLVEPDARRRAHEASVPTKTRRPVPCSHRARRG